jgi:hypothetical protein
MRARHNQKSLKNIFYAYIFLCKCITLRAKLEHNQSLTPSTPSHHYLKVNWLQGKLGRAKGMNITSVQRVRRANRRKWRQRWRDQLSCFWASRRCFCYRRSRLTPNTKEGKRGRRQNGRLRWDPPASDTSWHQSLISNGRSFPISSEQALVASMARGSINAMPRLRDAPVYVPLFPLTPRTVQISPST